VVPHFKRNTFNIDHSSEIELLALAFLAKAPGSRSVVVKDGGDLLLYRWSLYRCPFMSSLFKDPSGTCTTVKKV
jgi:hypothetical protein